MRTIPSSNTHSNSLAPTASLTSAQRSPWHSPVPYLFGGLATMMGLIAFALVIVACSYWKFSDNLRNESGDRDLETGDGESANKESVKVYEEKILVIMAGDEKPTFLATPVCSKFSSFADGICKPDNKEEKNGENSGKPEKQVDTQAQATTPGGNEDAPEAQQRNQKKSLLDKVQWRTAQEIGQGIVLDLFHGFFSPGTVLHFAYRIPHGEDQLIGTSNKKLYPVNHLPEKGS